MTCKKDDIKRTVTEMGFGKSRSSEIVETLIDLIKATLASGDNVLISGFGKFSVKVKRERRGRNPATGESIMLNPRRTVTFRCSKQLREKVNQDIRIRHRETLQIEEVDVSNQAQLG